MCFTTKKKVLLDAPLISSTVLDGEFRVKPVKPTRATVLGELGSGLPD